MVMPVLAVQIIGATLQGIAICLPSYMIHVYSSADSPYERFQPTIAKKVPRSKKHK